MKGGKRLTAKEPWLGSALVDARKRRGLSAEDVVRQAHIPAHYIKMIESDDYGLISDQLYLLPFLRRYATFVGLDAEDIVTRFVHDVQRADSNAGRMAEPIPVLDSARSNTTRLATIAGAAAALIIAVVFFAAFSRHRHHTAPAAAPSTAASPKPLTTSHASAPAPAEEADHP